MTIPAINPVTCSDAFSARSRRALIRWIEGWYNPRRLHSTIDYNSPIEHENLYYRRGDGIAA